jgi:hypothetical protein
MIPVLLLRKGLAGGGAEAFTSVANLPGSGAAWFIAAVALEEVANAIINYAAIASGRGVKAFVGALLEAARSGRLARRLIEGALASLLVVAVYLVASAAASETAGLQRALVLTCAVGGAVSLVLQGTIATMSLRARRGDVALLLLVQAIASSSAAAYLSTRAGGDVIAATAHVGGAHLLVLFFSPVLWAAASMLQVRAKGRPATRKDLLAAGGQAATSAFAGVLAVLAVGLVVLVLYTVGVVVTGLVEEGASLAETVLLLLVYGLLLAGVVVAATTIGLYTVVLPAWIAIKLLGLTLTGLVILISFVPVRVMSVPSESQPVWLAWFRRRPPEAPAVLASPSVCHGCDRELPTRVRRCPRCATPVL